MANEYPNVAQVENDIKNGESYVLVNKQSKVIATAMFLPREKNPPTK